MIVNTDRIRGVTVLCPRLHELLEELVTDLQ